MSAGQASTRRCGRGWRPKGIGHATRISPATPSGRCRRRCRVPGFDVGRGVRPGSFVRSPNLLGLTAAAMRHSTNSVLRWERGFPTNGWQETPNSRFHTLPMSTQLSHLASRPGATAGWRDGPRPVSGCGLPNGYQRPEDGGGTTVPVHERTRRSYRLGERGRLTSLPQSSPPLLRDIRRGAYDSVRVASVPHRWQVTGTPGDQAT